MKRITLLILCFVLLASCLLSSCASGESLSIVQTGETATQTAEETVSTPKKKDDTLDILMIGNSFCTYYPDELWGVAKAAGIKMKICSVYYSGCSVQRHYESLYNGAAIYTLYTQKSSTRSGSNNLTLDQCLSADSDWDVISLQQHFGPITARTYEAASASVSSYPKGIYTALKRRCPDAALYWHQTWAYQVGYQAPGGQDPATRPEEDKVLSVETQTMGYENIRRVSQEICEENGVDIVPCGDAWQIARANPVVGDILCNNADGSAGDYYHDGEAGGQYLNACVWFEVLTKKSCIGNTFRPAYGLEEEVILALQNAAHEAVVAVYGEDFYAQA